MQSVIDHLEAGNTIMTSVHKSGICKQTYYNWREVDDKFRQAADEAIAKSEEALVDDIKHMAKTRDDWRALAWLLERRFPERWSAKQELKVETNQASNGTEEVISMLKQIQIKNNPSQPQEKFLQTETEKGDST